MPPKKVLEANIFIIDLNCKNLSEVRKVFYKIILKLTRDKLERKSLDVFKIILVGSKETNNVNNYNNISIFSDWSYYKEADIYDTIIGKLENVKSVPLGNIFEALELAVEHIQNDTIVEHYQPKNIIVLSDLLADTPKHVNKKTALKDIWLYVLGPKVQIPSLHTIYDVENWSKSVQPASSDVNLTNNLKIIQGLKHNGIIADLEAGWQLLFSYVADKKPPYPWYCDLMLGDTGFKVNVLKLVDDSPNFQIPKDNNVVTEDEDLGFSSAMINPDNGEIVENPVPAYKVKGHLAIFTEEQEKALDIETNEDKCFQFKYFVDSSVVSPIYFEDNTLSAVVADCRQSENWKTPLKALAEAMHELKVCAVTKRVYAKGPQFREMAHILFTCPDHGPECLLLAKLPFAHEIIWKKPVIKKNKTENLKSDLKNKISGYLSSITVTDDDVHDGKVIHGIREYFLQNPNFVSQFDHVINCILNEKYNKDRRKITGTEMHEILAQRSKISWECLKEALPKYDKTEK